MCCTIRSFIAFINYSVTINNTRKNLIISNNCKITSLFNKNSSNRNPLCFPDVLSNSDIKMFTFLFSCTSKSVLYVLGTNHAINPYVAELQIIINKQVIAKILITKLHFLLNFISHSSYCFYIINI